MGPGPSLFETSLGIAVLQVPRENLLAVPTTHPLRAAATQASVVARMPNAEAIPNRLSKKGTRTRAGGHARVKLFPSDDPMIRPPAIDQPHGVHPRVSCVNRRVPTSAHVNRIVLTARLYGIEELSGGLTPPRRVSLASEASTRLRPVK